jgi:hypothetical protein
MGTVDCYGKQALQYKSGIGLEASSASNLLQETQAIVRASWYGTGRPAHLSRVSCDLSHIHEDKLTTTQCAQLNSPEISPHNHNTTTATTLIEPNHVLVLRP